MFRLLTSVAVVLLLNAWGSAQAYQFAFDEKIAIDAHPDIKTDLGGSDTRKVHVFDLGHLSGVLKTMIRDASSGRSTDIKSGLPYHPHDQVLVQVIGSAFETLRYQAESLEARAGELGMPAELAYLVQVFPTVFVEGARGIWRAMAKRQRTDDRRKNGWIENRLAAAEGFIAAAGASIERGMGKVRNAGLCRGPAGLAIIQQRAGALTLAHYLVTDTVEGVAGRGRSKPEVVIRAGIRAYCPSRSPFNTYERYRKNGPKRKVSWPVP